MGASSKRYDTTPRATAAVRDPLAGWLSGGKGFGGMFAEPGYIPNEIRGGLAGPVSTEFAPGRDIRRDMIRDVGGGGSTFSPENVQANFNPQQVDTQIGYERASAPATQSVDQLGGANSAFFQNMMGQLAPAFAQQRELAAAAAREGAGSLTGSGFANILGQQMNRTLGDQQGQLANYAAQGMQLEQGRQQADAGRMLQADLANQGAGLNAAELGMRGRLANQNAGLQGAELNLRGQMANQSAGLQGAELGLRGQMANQGADQAFVNQMLDQNKIGLQAQELGLRGQMANQDAGNQMYRQMAQLEAARQNQMGASDAELRNANANRYAQILGQQANAGVGPDTIQVDQGWEAMLGPLGTALGGMAAGGGGGGGNPMSMLMSLLGGGGGGGGQGGGQQVPWAPQGQQISGQGGGGLGPTAGFAGGRPGGSQIPSWLFGQGGNQLNPASKAGAAINRIPGGVNLGRGGSVLNPGAIGGALGGRYLGGALGSLIPIPGVGTMLGSALGGALGKPIGKIGKKVGRFLKKVF